MALERTERRLVAILAADVVGYSRLMGADEEGTLSTLNAHLAEFIESLIADHKGRIVKKMGDGLLVEFASVVDAVHCAVAWQEGMAVRNADADQNGNIVFRIGINIGDVIVQDDDVFGDGVNVAARLEGLAEPGGICISRSARDQIRDKLEYGLEDLGEVAVKNIARPVRVFRVLPKGVVVSTSVKPPAGKRRWAPRACTYWLISKDNRYIFVAGDGYDGRIHAKPNNASWRKKTNAMWRFKGVGNDVFTITDVRHNRQLIAGDQYNGKIYHQPAQNRNNAKWRVLRIHLSTPATRIWVYGNGRGNSIGVQPMRISADPYSKRWWLTGSDNSVIFYNRTDGWKGFRHEALDVHINDEGKPYFLSPALKLQRPKTGDARNPNRIGYETITSNAMRFDVDPLGYPIVIRHSGINQISQTFPKRDGSVPGAGSCSKANPWTFLSDYAKGRFNKMTSSVAGLAKGVASGNFDKIVTNMASFGAGGIYSHESFLGAVMQKIPVKEMQSIGKTVADLRETGYRGWGQAILGDGKKFVKMSKDVGSEILKGSFKGVAVAFYDNHPIKDYLLGPIVETDWSEDPMLVATKIQARYTLRTLKLKGEVLKYTPAGAAKYMAKAALKDAFKKHAQGYMLDALGKKRPVSPAEKRTINKVLAMVLQGLEAEFEAAENGLQTLSPLYTEAKLRDARALLVWNDKGSGADSDGSFWRSELSPGCISLGDMGQSGHAAPKMKQICNAAKGRGKWWDYPVDYELIWSDRCSGADSDGSVWLPRCKPGYVAIGFVANNTSNLAPWRDRVACLKSGPGMGTYSPLSKSQVKYTWNDKGSGAKQNIEVLSRKFGGYPMMYAWPERRGLKQTQQTYHWSAFAPIGNKAAAERAFGVTKSKGRAKAYLND